MVLIFRGVLIVYTVSSFKF